MTSAGPIRPMTRRTRSCMRTISRHPCIDWACRHWLIARPPGGGLFLPPLIPECFLFALTASTSLATHMYPQLMRAFHLRTR